MPVIVLGVLLLAAALFISPLAGGLPDIVAVHFNAAGAADGFATREGCRNFMFAFTLGAPLVVAAVTGGLPRILPASMINIPNRGYWLAPQRAAESLAFLSDQGIWFACILVVFLSVVDWTLVKANASVPPVLDPTKFVLMLVLFFCAMGWLMLRLFRRFRTP